MESSSGRLRSTAEGSTEKYRVLTELGEGGMANVCLAMARGPGGFNKLVVLKVLREELAQQSDLLTMFLDEARIAARLSHPNVVQTIEVTELRGRPAIVMEYLDGQPLFTILHSPDCREMTLAMRLRTVSAVLEGLQYIHDLADFDGTPLQLVHRDVSPHNVFVTFDGQVKLLDFGIAKGLISRGRTSTNVVKGKIRYMAPEQMVGQTVDSRADIFSAGVVLWEILTGKRIWNGKSAVNVLHAVLSEGVPPPVSVEPSVDGELNDICMRALQREPADRFQTAADFQTALDGFLDQTGSRITQRETGKFLAAAFAEIRTRTRDVIDAELKKSEETTDTTIARFPFQTHPGSLANVTESGSVEPMVASQSPPRRRWTALAAVLGIGALVVGSIFVFTRPAHDAGASPPEATMGMVAAPSAAATAAPRRDPPESASAAAAHTVVVQLSTSPEGAALFLDDKPIDNPFAGDYVPDATKHVLRAGAPGYVPASREIVLDRDVKVVLPLVPVPARPAPAANPHRAPVAAAQPAPRTVLPPRSTVTASTGSNCTPPFYFDAQGIKKLRPECL